MPLEPTKILFLAGHCVCFAFYFTPMHIVKHCEKTGFDFLDIDRVAVHGNSVIGHPIWP